MQMRRLSAASAVVALAAAGAIAGCGSGSGSGSGAGSGSGTAAPRSVTVRVTGDYDTLDPHKAIATASFSLNAPTYDRMVYANDKGEILPYLAKSWTVTPRSVEMKVRDDVTCADGAPLKPTDMAASLTRFTSPNTAAPNLNQWLGAGPFTVTSSGDTVTLRTKTPSGVMLAGLSNVSIICPAGLKDPGALANKPAGSGPYTLTKVRRGDSYAFTRRHDWTWGPKTAAGNPPETLTYKVVANDSTAANLLITHDLDLAQVSGPDTKRLANASGLKLHPVRDYGMTFAVFNEAPGHVTTDPALRRALAQAIDREAWDQAANNGLGNPAPSILPTNLACHEPATADVDPPYNPDIAKAALKQAGWNPGADGVLTKGGKPLAIRVIAWEGSQLGPDYLAAALQKIGAKATLAKTDIGTWLEAAQKGDFEINIVPSQQTAPIETANTAFLNGPGGKDGINWGLTKNAKAEQALAAAGKAVGERACGAWSEVQKAYAQQMDAKSLASETFSWFARDGLAFSAVGPVLFPWAIKAG